MKAGQYTYLIYSRTPRTVITWEDGTKETHPFGSTVFDDRVKERQADLRREHDVELKEWGKRRESFFEQSEVTPHTQGIMGRKTGHFNAVFPDGSRAEGMMKGAIQRAAYERFTKTSPQPQLEMANLGSQETKMCFEVAVGTGGPVEEVWQWNYGFPTDHLVQKLAELEAEGWQLVSVSEDRGIFGGAFPSTLSAITNARYLLRKAPTTS